MRNHATESAETMSLPGKRHSERSRGISLIKKEMFRLRCAPLNMTKRRPVSAITGIALALGLTFGFVPKTSASITFVQTNKWTLAQSDVEQRELWLLAETLVVEGRVEGALFAATGDADLNGAFARDVWATGKALQLGGTFEESARMVARSLVSLSGTIQRNAMMAAGETVQLEAGSVVGGDALLGGRTVLLRGRVDGNTTIVADRIIVSGDIGGTLYLRGRDISLLPGARVGGNLVYHAPHEIVPGTNVQIAGQMQRVALPERGRTGTILREAYFFAAALFAGLLFMIVAPAPLGRGVRHVRRHFWRSALAGSLGFILIPLVVVLLALTVIGLPASLVMLALYVTVLYLAKIVTALALGGWVLRRAGHQTFWTAAMALGVGLLLLYIIANLPIVGGIAQLVILFVGLGGLILGAANVQSVAKADRAKPHHVPPLPPA